MPRAKRNADAVRRVQRAYPQIYLACHVDHTTRRRAHQLSDRDASVLAHLDGVSPVTAGMLAKHLGIGPSTLTEAIDRLEDKGLVERTRRGRVVELRITGDGIAQMQAANVLDSERVAQLIAAVPPRRRAAAVEGIELLAVAARRVAKNRSF
ncbi:MAG: MarR family transcriptional regulator [Deltaproteobacteria bacterium]|nr:MarR family transcriptional regulator [Deltaproteobacteria bacterium]